MLNALAVSEQGVCRARTATNWIMVLLHVSADDYIHLSQLSSCTSCRREGSPCGIGACAKPQGGTSRPVGRGCCAAGRGMTCNCVSAPQLRTHRRSYVHLIPGVRPLNHPDHWVQAEALFPEAVACLSRAPSLEFDDEDFLPATEVWARTTQKHLAPRHVQLPLEYDHLCKLW